MTTALRTTLLCALLGGALAAQEPAPPPPRRGVLDVLEGARGKTDEAQPWIRLELLGGVGSPIASEFKVGPVALAHTVRPLHDTHLPHRPSLSSYVRLEVRATDYLAVQGSWFQQIQRGPRRHLHYKGVSVGGVFLPGGTPTRTTLDVQLATGSLRYLVLNDGTFYLGLGIGVAWGSFRVRLSGGDAGSVGKRVEEWFGPTLGYRFVFRAASFLSIYLENELGLIAPARLPATFTTSRIGLLWHFGEHVALVTGFQGTTGRFEDAQDLWGGRPRPGGRFRQASWQAGGGEVGLLLRF
ncbi:MAG: hypothetical protein R3F62_29890 [Planctomycetota bacterium]